MKAQIDITVDNARMAKSLVKALASDKKPKRSKVFVKSSGKHLLLSINSEDKAALRSALNTNLRLIDSCLKTNEVI